MDMIWIVGNMAIFCTVASNLAGLSVCLEFLKRKSTAGVSFLPFLAAVICTCLWLQYGIAVGDSVLIVVNLISVVIQVCYLGLYYFSTVVKNDVQRSVILATMVLLLIHVSVFHVMDKSTGSGILGYCASASSIICSAAPLPAVVGIMTGHGKVIHSRTTDGLPFPIIFAGFIVNTLWYIYGALIQDPFVKIPNAIGASLYGFQLSLFLIYSSNSTLKVEKSHSILAQDAKNKN